MEQTMIVSKKDFLEWFCKDNEKMLENKTQKAMFLVLLDKHPKAILEMVAHDVSSQIRQYRRETGDVDFTPCPNETNQLCDEVLEAFKKYFLPKNRA